LALVVAAGSANGDLGPHLFFRLSSTTFCDLAVNLKVVLGGCFFCMLFEKSLKITPLKVL
ncbi:hypothetical protein, partial [Melghirimyces profundicolus]|uniref:hypothetical protein n=1 Tax=Melghirimyces profundicolus TaxID=1242148 RepID=UPI001B87A5FD